MTTKDNETIKKYLDLCLAEIEEYYKGQFQIVDKGVSYYVLKFKTPELRIFFDVIIHNIISIVDKNSGYLNSENKDFEINFVYSDPFYSPNSRTFIVEIFGEYSWLCSNQKNWIENIQKN